MTPRSARRLLALLPLLLGGCSPFYVLEAGWHEAKILADRRPIREVVHATTTAPELRGKLRLVLDARDFAERSLGLEPGDSYTSFARIERDTLMLVVSAAPRFRMTWKTWWFPVVGRVPYRGYFDFDDARRKARELEEKGWDVYVRPTAAFSTLGWLPDPVLSTALEGDSVEIVETVVHEITHSTYFPSGHADFNESFANFVGHRGAIAFFCDALEQPENCRRARDRWHDTRAFGRFVTDLRQRLEALYSRDLPSGEMGRRKRREMEAASERFRKEVAPSFRAFAAGRLDPGRLNNAWLLARVLYYRRLDDFERVRRGHADVRSALEEVVAAARAASTPWEGLDELVGEEGP